MGLFDFFKGQPPAEPPKQPPAAPPPPPSQRVLASVERVDGAVALLHGALRLGLERLPPERTTWLSGLSTPILVEAEVQESGGAWLALSLGGVKPHPRVAALRAVQDQRWRTALELLAPLGERVAADPALLAARLRAHSGLDLVPEANADFAALCAHPAATAVEVAQAFRTLTALARPGAIAGLVAWVEAAAARDPALACRPLFDAAPEARWSAPLVARVVVELLASKPDGRALAEAAALLSAAEATGPHSALASAREQLAAAQAAQAKNEARQAKALLASRPDFDEVEALFACKLPPALRTAWGRHYEGQTVGFGFIAVKKGAVGKLATLSEKLERALGDDVRAAPTGMPHRLLPFAVGEHDDEYSALDLSRPDGAGDYAVVVAFHGRGEGWVTYPSSAAWLAADGITRHE
jgi:hypothetical protein